MYTIDLNQLTPQQFLNEYWQKKPLLIRQGISNFEDPISPDEFAGLAMEEQIESRLVWQKDGEWQAEHGPFEDYSHLGDKDWSLLIQGVDHWDEQVAELIRPFRFLPNWRIDDVMVSYATPGGGVGPHVDNYDVFIIQGSGKRHWQVGSNTELKEVVANSALLHVEKFTPIIDVELLPGDILYIPPGFPHQGVAIEPSMSFSVGFRTTAKSHLFSNFADYLIDQQLGSDMVVDPERQPTTTPGLIDSNDIDKLKSALHEMLSDDDKILDYLGNSLSQCKHELAIDPDLQDMSMDQLSEFLQDDESLLIRIGGLRCMYFDQESMLGRLYVNGESYVFSQQQHAVTQLLANNSELGAQQLQTFAQDDDFKIQLLQLINLGYWYWQE